MVSNADVLRRNYQQSLESNRLDELRGRKKEIDEALTHKQGRFEKDFSALDLSEVEAAAAKEPETSTT